MVNPSLPVPHFKERGEERFLLAVLMQLPGYVLMGCTAPVPGSVPHFTSIYQMGYHGGKKTQICSHGV